MKDTELEFDKEMEEWFRVGAALMPITDVGSEEYAEVKAFHQEAAEQMAKRLNDLRRIKRQSER